MTLSTSACHLRRHPHREKHCNWCTPDLRPPSYLASITSGSAPITMITRATISTTQESWLLLLLLKLPIDCLLSSLRHLPIISYLHMICIFIIRPNSRRKPNELRQDRMNCVIPLQLDQNFTLLDTDI
ncbi:hypothetical protein M422DRAFT_255891 [Sphaerobolus stellatus SS14]|uniref:Uncharacterized protein n=1 Tax=Sphaerobolus stellatus (strain SS14) TaxID=990650 RepID=A0A0C9TU26_SPHS4|nr:hypothetical protein M422DRAFT_273683 [Sphaerobolus stellatus SS14]KIJ41045.1 hypothetical protein M422DRAFT_255891 [Sphaerobolus stellatus SS14]